MAEIGDIIETTDGRYEVTRAGWVPLDSAPPFPRAEPAHLHTPLETDATLQHRSSKPPELAREQDILGLFGDAMTVAGVVGEGALVATEYLAITSRVLPKPVSLVVKGASSSGKSFSTETVVSFFPAQAVCSFTGMSEKALLLSERSYEHRTIVIYEAAALRERAERQSGDQTAYYLRSLVSEGETHYEMSVRGKDGAWTTKRFDKRGPTNVIVTTTSFALHNENETRMLSLSTNDSPAQTRAVLRAIATEARDRVDRRPWHEFQDWIFRQDNRVHIPYAGELAEAVPLVAVRLRRDFRAVLSLIEAHAVLHQLSRDRDAQGRIIATPADYDAVRALVLGVVSEGVGAQVSPTVRETVEAVRTTVEAFGGDVPASAIVEYLKLDKSTTSRRLTAAIRAGFVVNNEERRGRPGKYALGEPLPDEQDVLPELQRNNTPEDETAGHGDRCSVAGDSEGEPKEDKADAVGESAACVRCGRYGGDHVGGHTTRWGTA